MKNIIITGAGRSGTSLLAGLFPEQYYRGGKQVGAWEANPSGFFESKEVNRINELLISQKSPNNPNFKNFKKGIRSNFALKNGFNFGERWLFHSTAIENLDFTISNNIGKKINKIVSHHPFCLKDPRFSLTLPAWDAFLPKNTGIIYAFRSPLQTVSSLLKFAHARNTEPLKQIDFNTAIEIWNFQNQQNLLNFKTSKRNWHFIHYDQIKQENALKSLEEFAETKLQKNFFDPKLNRSVNPEGIAPEFVRDTYQELCKLANFKE